MLMRGTNNNCLEWNLITFMFSFSFAAPQWWKKQITLHYVVYSLLLFSVFKLEKKRLLFWHVNEHQVCFDVKQFESAATSCVYCPSQVDVWLYETWRPEWNYKNKNTQRLVCAVVIQGRGWGRGHVYKNKNQVQENWGQSHWAGSVTTPSSVSECYWSRDFISFSFSYRWASLPVTLTWSNVWHVFTCSAAQSTLHTHHMWTGQSWDSETDPRSVCLWPVKQN